MSKKKNKKKSKEIAPHIKAFVLKQKLDMKLYNTDIVTYQCDRQEKSNEFHKDKFEPKSVIVGVASSIGDQMSLQYAIDDIGGVIDAESIDGIDILMIHKNNPKINKYLDGDF